MLVWWQFCSWITGKAILWHFVLGKRTKQFCGTVLRILANDFVVFRPYIDSFCPMPIAKCFEWLFYSQLFQHSIMCSILSVNICCLDLSPAVSTTVSKDWAQWHDILRFRKQETCTKSPWPFFFFRPQLSQMSYLRQWSLRENGCSGRNRKAVTPWSPFCKLTAGNWS